MCALQPQNFLWWWRYPVSAPPNVVATVTHDYWGLKMWLLRWRAWTLNFILINLNLKSHVRLASADLGQSTHNNPESRFQRGNLWGGIRSSVSCGPPQPQESSIWERKRQPNSALTPTSTLHLTYTQGQPLPTATSRTAGTKEML